MKCPVCQEKNLESSVYPGMGTCTAMYCAPYYDTTGKYHHHNLNTTTTSYSCSRGHRWDVSRKGNCPSCDFGSDTEQIAILNSEEIVCSEPIYDFSLFVGGTMTHITTTSDMLTIC